MKNAKEIKFERSLDSYKSMNQIKKNTDFLYELLNSLNAYKILNVFITGIQKNFKFFS